MANDRELALTVLRASRWMIPLPQGLAELLAAEGALRRHDPGSWLQAEGDEAAGVMVLVQGAAELYGRASNQKDVCLAYLKSGAAWGQTPDFGGGPRLATVICAEPCLVLHLSDQTLRRIAHARPDVWQAVTGLLYLQLGVAMQWAADLLALGPRERIATRLLSMMQAGAPNDVFHLSQQSLAEMVGLTRKTVNLHLAALRDEGAVQLEYGRIRILDAARLQRAVTAQA
ncbi:MULTISPECIES: Crp/Fnr family transcriptional regulator [Phenylobacterium]|uniref:CRP-like cAMP-binding protein n=1 Tax=Phenylobacterium koreense TaxID=266125 RepID=A0ABV2EGY5_9CAUL